jgi:SWIM zinc finger
MSEEPQGNGKARDDFMIVSRTEDGYRAYLASHPNQQYLVSGNLDDPACTCDSFADDATCEHVRAVLQQFGEDAQVERDERAAIQAEGQPTPSPKKRGGRSNGAPAMMLLKRSVSPDGRIDSLSVELSCPIEQRSNADIKSRASSMLQLQSEIAKGFLGTNGQPKSNGDRNGHHRSGRQAVWQHETTGPGHRRCWIPIR